MLVIMTKTYYSNTMFHKDLRKEFHSQLFLTIILLFAIVKLLLNVFYIRHKYECLQRINYF